MRSDLDEKFMQHALMLADRAEALGEIPVGAVLVDDEGNILGEGWNLSIIEMIRPLMLKLSHCVTQHKIFKIIVCSIPHFMSPLSLVLCVRVRFYIAELNV